MIIKNYIKNLEELDKEVSKKLEQGNITIEDKLTLIDKMLKIIVEGGHNLMILYETKVGALDEIKDFEEETVEDNN